MTPIYLNIVSKVKNANIAGTIVLRTEIDRYVGAHTHVHALTYTPREKKRERERDDL